METLDKWNKDLKAHKLLDKKVSSKQDGRIGIKKHLHNAVSIHSNLQIQAIGRSECAGSCPNLMMSRNNEQHDHHHHRPAPMSLTPQLPPRAHRPLCLSVSSDSNGRFKALDSQEWKNNLKAQMEQAHSAGAASSTGSLERASLFCAPSSGLSSPVESLTKGKSSSRFSLFSPPWNSSSESDSNPPSRSGSKKLRNYSRRAATVPAGVGGVGGRGGPPDTPPEPPKQPPPPGGEQQHFQYAEPVISKVTDYLYVGNLNAAYNGRTLCRNNIDSVIDMSGLPGEGGGPGLSLVPCTCSARGARHSWSRLKVDLGGAGGLPADDGTLLLGGPAPLALRHRCFEDINGCIDASTEKRRRVLVHCRDGFSLAPTCVIQYLMVRQDMRLIAAYELLRAKYPVNIREAHRDVLVSLERALRPGGSVEPECFKQAISRRVAWT